MGMLSKNQVILGDYDKEPSGNDEFVIKRNRNKVLCFNEESARNYIGEYDKINLGYFTEKVKSKDMSFYAKSTALITGPFHKDNFLKFKGLEFQEYRETINSLDKRVLISDTMIHPETDIKNVVSKWDDLAGKRKYGWQLHSGYDRNFFNTGYFLGEKDNLQSLFFYDKETMECIGYSVISKKASSEKSGLVYPLYSYIIRKYSPEKKYRNLCLYIDLKAVQRLVKDKDEQSIVHWGASSGGVLNYKRSKFKNFIFREYDVWFGKMIEVKK